MKPETDGLSIQTKAFVGVTALIGVVVLGYALAHWQSHDLTRFVCYLAVAILASGFRLRFDGLFRTLVTMLLPSNMQYVPGSRASRHTAKETGLQAP